MIPLKSSESGLRWGTSAYIWNTFQNQRRSQSSVGVSIKTEAQILS